MRPNLLWVVLLCAACKNPPPVEGPFDSGPAPLSCAAPLVACPGATACSDLNLDDAHCGDCGNACPADQACAGGACYARACAARVCAGTQVCVGDACIDRSCFSVMCPPGQVCAGGACQPTTCGGQACPSGQVCIGDVCTDASCVGVLCPGGTRCVRGFCAADTCGDGVKNGDETAADCGGSCPPCVTGQGCSTAGDCVSLSCVTTACAAPSCSDGVRNGGEGDADCGGPCPPCAEGRRCSQGSQCESGVCPSGTCVAPTCMDGVKNGTETDKDCGGACVTCADGFKCMGAGDCKSASCLQGLCVSSQCLDGMKDGAETDTDCGGGACPGCIALKACSVAGDCQSGVCSMVHVCLAPSCTDTVKNGSETDTDCGAGCPGCAGGKVCKAPTDCASLLCASGRCTVPSCSDGTLNGGESDVDCGGNTMCPRCGGAKKCTMGPDCISSTCTTMMCTVPTAFASPASYAAGSGAWDLAVADIDHDGHLDVLSSATNDFTLHVWFGDGTGALLGAQTVQVAAGGMYPYTGPRGVAVGDPNGDGVMDLITGRGSVNGFNSLGCRITILKGLGSRTFAPGVDLDDNDLSMLSGCGNRLLVARWNADGVDDIVTSDSLATAYDGDAYGGTFLAGTSGMFAAQGHVPGPGPFIAMADFDLDGVLDLVSHSTRYSNLAVLKGVGDGTFMPVTSFGVGLGDGDVATGKLNADGVPDIVYATKGANQIAVVLSNGSGGWIAPASYTVGHPDGVAIADFDRDGKLDLVVGGDGVAFLKGHGDGTFDPAQVSAASLGDTGALRVGDFNQDNKLDVAVIAGSNVVVLFNQLP